MEPCLEVKKHSSGGHVQHSIRQIPGDLMKPSCFEKLLRSDCRLAGPLSHTCARRCDEGMLKVICFCEMEQRFFA